jgi:hypothetical protein
LHSKSEQYSPLPTISFSSHNSSTLLPTPVTNSTPTKRKSKVPGSGKRNTDIEFATEIGQGLLIEVRKLQAALQNKEDIIKQLHMSKSDDERTTEMLMKHLKQKEESEGLCSHEICYDYPSCDCLTLFTVIRKVQRAELEFRSCE